MNKRYEPSGRLSRDKDVMKFPKMADEGRPASFTQGNHHFTWYYYTWIDPKYRILVRYSSLIYQ